MKLRLHIILLSLLTACLILFIFPADYHRERALKSLLLFRPAFLRVAMRWHRRPEIAARGRERVAAKAAALRLPLSLPLRIAGRQYDSWYASLWLLYELFAPSCSHLLWALARQNCLRRCITPVWPVGLGASAPVFCARSVAHCGRFGRPAKPDTCSGKWQWFISLTGLDPCPRGHHTHPVLWSPEWRLRAGEEHIYPPDGDKSVFFCIFSSEFDRKAVVSVSGK